jgi:hypothetical protein
MDDPQPKLTEALQSRIWAALQQLDHRLREKKQIGWNECIREAYLACARELPAESAVALVVRYGRKLKWLHTTRQTRRGIVGYMRGMGRTLTPAEMPGYEAISEAGQRAWITEQVADLIEGKAPRRAAVKRARYPERAVWLQARLAERKWNKHDLARYGGPDHKTTQKVLDGFAVQDSVLAKIAAALKIDLKVILKT